MEAPSPTLHDTIAERFRTGTDVSAMLGHVSVGEEAILRGHHRNPGELDERFSIDRLAHNNETLVDSMPIREVFAWAKTAQAEQFASSYLDGTTPVEIVEDVKARTAGSNKPGFKVSVPVPRSEYRNAVIAGKVSGDLFEQGDEVSHMQPGADALSTLVNLREALTVSCLQQSDVIERNYIDDLEGIRDLDKLHEVTEAYEFSVGEGDAKGVVRLLNFSKTRLTEEQLKDTADNVRVLANVTDGSKRLRTIAILPKEHPSLMGEVYDAERGGYKMLPRNSYQSTHLLAFSELNLYPPEDRPPVSPEAIKAFEKYLAPGEPAQGPGSPKRTVSSGRWGVTLAHEMTHMALAAIPNPPGVAKKRLWFTLYSRFSEGESRAERGAARYIGGDDAARVREDERQDLEALLLQARGGKPEGNYFVKCQELDLTKGRLARRLQYPDRPLPVEINYRLVDDPEPQ